MNRSVHMTSVVFWGLVSVAASKVIGFIANILLSNSLGAKGYGEYGAVLTTLTLFGLAAQASLGSAATTLVSRELTLSKVRASDMLVTIATILVCLAALSSASLFMSSDLIARVVYSFPRLSTALRISAITLFVLALQSGVDGALGAFRDFHAKNALPVLQVTIFVGLMLMFRERIDVDGTVYNFTMSAAAALIYGMTRLYGTVKKAGIRVTLVSSLTKYIQVLNFIGPLSMIAVLVIGTNWLISVFLARIDGGFADLGAYTAATQLRVAILTVPFLLHSIYSPMLSGEGGESNSGAFRALALDCYRATQLACLPVAGIMIIMSSVLMAVFGREFTGAQLVLSLSCILAYIMVISNLAGIILVAVGRGRHTVFPNVLSSGVICLFAPLAVSHYRTTGLLIVLIGGQIVQMAALLLEARRAGVLIPVRYGVVLPMLMLALLLQMHELHTRLGACFELVVYLIMLGFSIANMPSGAIKRFPKLGKLVTPIGFFRLHRGSCDAIS